jgi:thymidylate synthase (FAD)
MLACLKRMLGGEAMNQEQSGLSKREWREFMDALGRAA